MKSRRTTFIYKNPSKIYVAIAVAIALFLWWFWISDPHVKQTEQFLFSSPELSEKIGELRNLNLIQTNIVYREGDHGRAKEPDLKEYRFIANGKIAKAEVIVLVKIGNTNQVESIKIVSIEL